MKVRSQVVCDTDNATALFDVVSQEQSKKDRSELIITKQKKSVTFEIVASDVSAHTASMHHVLKLLSIYEKTRLLMQNVQGRKT